MQSATYNGASHSASNISNQSLDWSVWLMFVISFVVYIEPAPVDLMFGVVLFFFASSRLRATVGVVPLLLILVVYNVGGFLSYAFTPPQPKALMFLLTSTYMAVTAIIFALYIAGAPNQRMELIGAAWSIGAVCAAIWGMIDYFHLPSPFPLQVLPGRATGLFKDPNVYSTYMIFPMVFMLQKLILGTTERPVLISISLAITSLGLFLSFSRGAWANFVVAALLFAGLTFLLFNSSRLRMRLVIYVVAALAFFTIAFLILMSIPFIQKMFLERFALVQYYDAGETGRFGNQLRSIPALLRLPLGYGPFEFEHVYGQAPHNTFLNAFVCYGWLGGIAYALLIVSTLSIGVKTIFKRTPWQGLSIAVFASLVSVIFQGVQIDTEHWRHFYWMLAMMWGLFAITIQPDINLRPQSSTTVQAIKGAIRT